MSEAVEPLELILQRQAALDRRMDALAGGVDSLADRVDNLASRMDTLVESIQSLTRMFEAQFRDVHARLDGVERVVRVYAGEQITMANQIINAQQRADQAYARAGNP